MHRIFFYTFFVFLLFGCSDRDAKTKKILFVTSNQHTYGNSSINAANHFSEIVLAYDVYTSYGYSVDFISPEGGAIPIGYIATSDSIQKKYLYDTNFMNKLKTTKKPKDVNASDYDAIYYSGGGAAMFGVPEHPEIQSIAQHIHEQNGIISAVCHGTAGIVYLKDNMGNPLYRNRKINGFPDFFERKDAAYYQTFPFSIEKEIEAHEGTFIYTKTYNANFYTEDGNFITGQDPSSTKMVAQKVIEALTSKHNK